jgi:hypothetical protein
MVTCLCAKESCGPASKGNKTCVSTTNAPATPAAPAGPGGGSPRTVFGGVGLFYKRVSEDVTLQSFRFNGITQQQFLVTDPTVLNLFPLIPPVNALEAFAQPQTRRVTSDELGPSRSFRAMFVVERQLTKTVKLSATYAHAHTVDTQRTVNINAPLGGTFIPGFQIVEFDPWGKRGQCDAVPINRSNGWEQSQHQPEWQSKESEFLDWL